MHPTSSIYSLPQHIQNPSKEKKQNSIGYFDSLVPSLDNEQNPYSNSSFLWESENIDRKKLAYDPHDETTQQGKNAIINSLRNGEYGNHPNVKALVDNLSTPLSDLNQYHEQAQANLQSWKKGVNNRPQSEKFNNFCGQFDGKVKFKDDKIVIINGDCMNVAQKLAECYGENPLLLNMANARAFGGGYWNGCNAQEEHMARTSDLFQNQLTYHTYLFDDFSVTNPNVDYNSQTTRLIQGKDGTVFYNPYPVVCFREKLQGGGYDVVNNDKMFKFHEVRAAAEDLRIINDGSITGTMEFNTETCKKTIRSLFNTLIQNKQKHLVLSALGCGEFKNPPEKVAEIFYQVLQEKYSDGSKIIEHFDLVTFAIFDTKAVKNSEVFSQTFNRLSSDVENKFNTKEISKKQEEIIKFINSLKGQSVEQRKSIAKNKAKEIVNNSITGYMTRSETYMLCICFEIVADLGVKSRNGKLIFSKDELRVWINSQDPENKQKGLNTGVSIEPIGDYVAEYVAEKNTTITSWFSNQSYNLSEIKRELYTVLGVDPNTILTKNELDAVATLFSYRQDSNGHTGDVNKNISSAKKVVKKLCGKLYDKTQRIADQVKVDENKRTASVDKNIMNVLSKKPTLNDPLEYLGYYSADYLPSSRIKSQSLFKQTTFDQLNSVKVYCKFSNDQEINNLLGMLDLLLRDSVNIGMKCSCNLDGKSHSLLSLLKDAKKLDEGSFRKITHHPAISSKATLYNVKDKVGYNVTILSVAAPSLENTQPLYDRFIISTKNNTKSLNERLYKKEMQRIANILYDDICTRKKAGEDIKRVFISSVGQGAFLGEFADGNSIVKGRAGNIYNEVFNAIEEKIRQSYPEVEILKHDDGVPNVQKYDIRSSVKTGDYILNAWDMHSQPGNGNGLDNSLDGRIGRRSNIFFIQSILANPILRMNIMQSISSKSSFGDEADSTYN